MNYLRAIFLTFAIVVSTQWVIASGLELRIRAHSGSVAFGDPLYIEVTIVNAGTEPVSAPDAFLEANTFSLWIRNPETDTMIPLRGSSGGGFAVADTKVYEPGKPIKHNWYVFVPAMWRFDHPFWKPLQDGHRVELLGFYHIGRGHSLSGNRIEVVLAKRKDSEMQALNKWAPTKRSETWERGPLGASFGLRFLEPLVRDQVLEARKVFKTGEIADLLELTLQMQDLYASKPEDREPGNEKLVTWLKKQVDIKRQALAIEARNRAEGNHMRSTQLVIQDLISDAAFMSETSAGSEKSR